jgi:Phosphoribosyl-ATP pyrophosphohydrolase.
MSNFEDVKKFMKTFGQMVKTDPQFPDEKTMQLRYDLIKEELNELEIAMKNKKFKRDS